MKIYTKTGDKGETSLIGGVRLKKSATRIQAYGTVDELNSWMGVICNIEEIKSRQVFRDIQDRLFTIGSHLASHPVKGRMELPGLSEKDIHTLEKEIDLMESELPELRSFILPGSSTENGYCHVARTVCRRAERCVVELSLQEETEPIILAYLNRLSDYLFVLARFVSHLQNRQDITWNAG